MALYSIRESHANAICRCDWKPREWGLLLFPDNETLQRRLLATNGHFGPCVAISGPYWPDVATSGHIWPMVVTAGPILPKNAAVTVRLF
jgi:hypothetical protein